MKVVTKFYEDTDGYGDYLYKIEVDGHTFCSIGHIEPEDCTLFRDLNFVMGIPLLLAKAHAAGVAGEPFDIDEIDVNDLEEFYA